ncbi:1564_t:CDS:2, partial [Scutellospora calospora]
NIKNNKYSNHIKQLIYEYPNASMTERVNEIFQILKESNKANINDWITFIQHLEYMVKKIENSQNLTDALAEFDLEKEEKILLLKEKKLELEEKELKLKKEKLEILKLK